MDLSDGVSLTRPAGDEPASLREVAAADQVAASIPSLAEAHRRAGRPAEARRVAEEALIARPDDRDARLVLGLALLDLGELDTAREVLAGGLGSACTATPEDSTTGMQAALAAPCSEPRIVAESVLGEPDDLEIDRAFDSAESDPSQMMDANRVAERVLDEEMRDLALEPAMLHDDDESPILDAAFVDDPLSSEPMDDANRARMLATLETWLQNIRRPVV